MAKETRVKAKVLKSFSSAAVDGTLQGYRPQTTVELPAGIASGWADVGLVELEESVASVTPAEPFVPAPRRGRPPLPRDDDGNPIRE